MENRPIASRKETHHHLQDCCSIESDAAPKNRFEERTFAFWAAASACRQCQSSSHCGLSTKKKNQTRHNKNIKFVIKIHQGTGFEKQACKMQWKERSQQIKKKKKKKKRKNACEARISTLKNKPSTPLPPVNQFVTKICEITPRRNKKEPTRKKKKNWTGRSDRKSDPSRSREEHYNTDARTLLPQIIIWMTSTILRKNVSLLREKRSANS